MPHQVTPPKGDPAADAWAWLSQQLKGRSVPAVIACIGLGAGELLDALDLHAPATRVLALEPDPDTAATLRASPTGRAWIESGRLAYLIGPDYAGADEAWRIFPGTAGAPPVLVHPSVKPTAEATQSARVLKQILAGVAANREARRKFAPRYLVNSIRNVPAMAAGSDVRRLADAYHAVPAVIAAAGPSLDAAVPQLHDVHTRALLIACDTALRPLLLGGIAPQVVVGVDPSDLNARHMLSLPECASTWLASESALDRAATAPFDGRTFWFRVSNHEPWPWLNELGLDIGQIDVWGSVLTAAFQIACLAGCNPIVLVGADLSYTGGRPYARATTYELDWALGTASGVPLEDIWRKQMSAGELVTVPDVRGRDTISTTSLVSFRDWLVGRAARSGRRVVNAAGDGILHGPGVEQGTIAVLTGTFDVPPVGRFASRPAGVRPSRLSARVREAHARLMAADPIDPLRARWQEFSGEGFDTEALGAALDEAAQALEAKPGSHAAAAPLIPWARLGAAPVPAGFFAQLPELLARLRAALSGTGQLPSLAIVDALAEDDRRALLVEALELLGRIHEALRRGDDVLPMTAPWHAGQPASIVYAWPERVRWAVEIFEGLLGAAWDGTATGRPGAFFTSSAGRSAHARDGSQAPAPERLHAAHACMVLAREWTECWMSLDASEAPRDAPARLTGPESAVDQAGGGAAPHAAFTLRAESGRSTASFELPLPPSFGWLSATMICPRLVSAPGERWAIAYSLDRGAVCVRLNDAASFVLHGNARREPHRTWPRAILSELPFGDGGAVAWASGRADPANIVPPYVMYRRTANEDPIIEDLPFNPSWGAWWNGRLYWGFLPSEAQPARGLGSWAPGSGARIELTADATFFDLRADETGLLLEPSTRRPDHTYERRPLTSGWRWSPEIGLESRPLGPHGASGSRVVAHGWTTTTFPEADLITFEAADGTSLAMAAYYPFRAAWLGSSLLVSTVDYQLLLFEDVLGRLAADGTRACT